MSRCTLRQSRRHASPVRTARTIGCDANVGGPKPANPRDNDMKRATSVALSSLSLRIALMIAVLIATFSQLAAGGQCNYPPSGLVSWWPGEGTADDAFGGNPGGLVNGVTFTPGKVGQAFNFNGVSDYVRL